MVQSIDDIIIINDFQTSEVEEKQQSEPAEA